MKISKDTVASLVKTVRGATTPETVAGTGQELTVYYLDDLTLSFTQGEKPAFFGLTFEALGRDFYVIANLDLLVTAENDEGDPEAYMVEDEKLAEAIDHFLQWRTDVLEKFGA